MYLCLLYNISNFIYLLYIIYFYNNRDEIREKAICGKQKCATEFFDSVMARNVASLYREMLGDI